MIIRQSNTFLRSFTWTFGTGKGFDSGLLGVYNTPLELQQGDIIQNSSIYSIVSVVGGPTLDLQDAGGNSLGLPATLLNPFATNSCTVFAFFSSVSVIVSGFMKLQIFGAPITAGSFRIDLEIYRQY